MRKTYIKIASIVLSVVAVGTAVFVYQNYSAAADPSTPSAGSASVTTSTDAGRWKEDPEVTAVGKAGARAREVLNWALSIKDAGFTGAGNNTLKDTWAKVRDIMGVFYFVILITIGFGLIAKQDWAERTRRSLPALIIAFVAAYFSYFVEGNIIKFTDQQIQQRFYTIHNWDKSGTLEQKHLRAQDLLTVSFSYQEFKGYKKVGAAYGEAIANHLLLIKITTVTNYVIAFIIILRIIILWGLVIFSPFMFPFFVFPLTKRVATVWVREFFRWLLLGPLFALFLTSVPYMWNKTNISVKDVYPGQKATNSGIPLEVQKEVLNPSTGGDATSGNVYESGTNIILSPPGNSNPDLQKDSNISSGNNLSETDTYARWIVALLMIWGAIILPFMLLRVVMGFSVEIGKGVSNVFGGSQAAQYINNLKKVVNPPPPAPAGPGPGSSIIRDKLVEKIPTIMPTKQITDRSERISSFNEKSIEKLSVPTILNVAGLKQEIPELYNLSNAAENESTRKISELAKIEQQAGKTTELQNTISNIAQPEKISEGQEQQKFEKVKQGILMRSVAGDKSAQAMKNAISGNVSQYLVSDIGNEISEDFSKNFNDSVSKITNEQVNQTELQQIQNTYGVSNVKNFTDILSGLSAKQDVRGQQALSAVSRIKDAENVPAAERTAYLQKLSLNISSPQMISDPAEKQDYMALKEVIQQGANSGITSMKELLEHSQAFANFGLSGTQLLSNKMKDLSATITSLSSNISSDPKYQMKAAALNEFGGVLQTAISSNNAGSIKQAAQAISAVNNPEEVKDPAQRQKYQSISELLQSTAQNGMENALSAKTVIGEIAQDLEIDREGNATISSIAALRKSMQNNEDYLKTKESWETHYMNAPLQSGKDRKIWLSEEIKELESSLNNLISNDPTKKKTALESIQKIIPLALMGNYKASEIAKYLLAKLDAAKAVLTKITVPAQKGEQEQFVNVSNSQNKSLNNKTMAQEEENENAQ